MYPNFELLDLTIANPDVVGIHQSVRFSDITYGATEHKFHRSTTEKWSKMRTTIYPVSPIDEDARSAINVEFSQLRNTMLLESESDLIQPVEISYKLLRRHLQCQDEHRRYSPGSHQVLHAKYILNSSRKSVRWLCLGSGPTHLLLLLETRTILHGLTVQNVDFISPDAMFRRDIRDVVTDHMLNTCQIMSLG
jgi:hypothetical protein